MITAGTFHNWQIILKKTSKIISRKRIHFSAFKNTILYFIMKIKDAKKLLQLYICYFDIIGFLKLKDWYPIFFLWKERENKIENE